MLLAASPDMELGARLYLDNCNACHFSTGTGADGVFPELVGNSTVLANEPGGFLHVILNGAELPSTATRPARLRMPPFRDRLSDDEVAVLATFVRQAWGNKAAPIAATSVGEIREKSSDDPIVR
jgi:mono/diheme cytochrome c family protein